MSEQVATSTGLKPKQTSGNKTIKPSGRRIRSAQSNPNSKPNGR